MVKSNFSYLSLRNELILFMFLLPLFQASSVGVKADKIRRVWEPTYVIVYKEHGEKESSPVSSVGDENRRCSSSQSSILPQLPMLSQSQCSMDEVLQLLRQLYIISTEEVESVEEEEEEEEHFGAQGGDSIEKCSLEFQLEKPL